MVESATKLTLVLFTQIVPPGAGAVMKTLGLALTALTVIVLLAFAPSLSVAVTVT